MSVQVGPQWRIAQAERVRAAMGVEMCSVADALREAFGAKLVWLDAPGLTVGEKPEMGVTTQWNGERRSVA